MTSDCAQTNAVAVAPVAVLIFNSRYGQDDLVLTPDKTEPAQR